MNVTQLTEFLKTLTLKELRHLQQSLSQKRDFSEFLSFMRNVLMFRVAQHHRDWNELLGHSRLCVQSARDHGKTTFFSVSYPLWKAVNTPDFHACIISYSEPQSKHILRTIKSKLETQPAFYDLLTKSHKSGFFGQSVIRFSNGSFIQAKSFGSSLRGQHYDLIVVDDPIKDRSAIPQDDLSSIFFGVITPAAKNPGQIIVVGTPIEFGDLFDILEKNQEYNSFKYPALDGDGHPLWEDQYSVEALEKRRKEIPNYWIFAREYLLQRIDPETAPFKEPWFKWFDEAPDVPLNKLISVDPAITEVGDYTAMVVTGTDSEGTTWLLDYKRIKTHNVGEIVAAIVDLCRKNDVRRMVTEAIGFQRLLKYWLVREMEAKDWWMSIEELKYHRSSKRDRILNLQPKIEAGKFIFRRGYDEIVNELRSFPKGKYDDLIDALSMQLPLLRTPDAVSPEVPEGSAQWYFDLTDQQKTGQDAFGLFEDLHA